MPNGNWINLINRQAQLLPNLFVHALATSVVRVFLSQIMSNDQNTEIKENLYEKYKIVQFNCSDSAYNGWYQIRDDNKNVAMLKGLYDKNGEYTTNIWRTRNEAEEQLQLIVEQRFEEMCQ